MALNRRFFRTAVVEARLSGGARLGTGTSLLVRFAILARPAADICLVFPYSKGTADDCTILSGCCS